MAFMVWASRAISSSLRGSGTRRARSRSPMAATSARMASTGRSARPVARQVRAAVVSSRSPLSAARAAVVTSSAASTVRSEAPTWMVTGPVGEAAVTVVTRWWCSAPRACTL